MDLVGNPEKTKIVVAMEHCDKKGGSKIVEVCGLHAWDMIEGLNAYIIRVTMRASGEWCCAIYRLDIMVGGMDGIFSDLEWPL